MRRATSRYGIMFCSQTKWAHPSFLREHVPKRMGGVRFLVLFTYGLLLFRVRRNRIGPLSTIRCRQRRSLHPSCSCPINFATSATCRPMLCLPNLVSSKVSYTAYTPQDWELLVIDHFCNFGKLLLLSHPRTTPNTPVSCLFFIL